MPPAIVFDRVTKQYPHYQHITAGLKHFLFQWVSGRAARHPRFTALEDISFEVQAGEAFGVIGRNGAGKSTLLGLMAGVLQPTRGRVETRGRIHPLLELGTGFHPELSGRENIELNGILLGLRRRDVRARLDAIIGFSELAEFIDQPIRTYSSGMLARLAFAVVANLDPEILLIDEILAVGDAPFQHKCLQRIREFKRQGVTIVFVSHALDQVIDLCDRVLWVQDHRIRLIGVPADVTRAYAEEMA